MRGWRTAAVYALYGYAGAASLPPVDAITAPIAAEAVICVFPVVPIRIATARERVSVLTLSTFAMAAAAPATCYLLCVAEERSRRTASHVPFGNRFTGRVETKFLHRPAVPSPCPCAPRRSEQQHNNR